MFRGSGPVSIAVLGLPEAREVSLDIARFVASLVFSFAWQGVEKCHAVFIALVSSYSLLGAVRILFALGLTLPEFVLEVCVGRALVPAAHLWQAALLERGCLLRVVPRWSAWFHAFSLLLL